MGVVFRVLTVGFLAATLSGCGGAGLIADRAGAAPPVAVSAERAQIDGLIAYYAQYYHVPESLVRSVTRRESNFNPRARNGPYRGLMQIHPVTARTMGYRGSPDGLFDPDTNLRYAVKYLAGAYLVARGNAKLADHYYQTGYYYVAKRMGLLEETGLRPAR